MRTSMIALALATLIAVPAPAWADDITDCNGDKPDAVIQGCSNIIDAGKAGANALAVAHFNRANAYDDNGDHDSAIADYTQAIKLRPDYADSYFNRGLSYFDKQDYDSAIADYRKVIELDPAYAKAYFGQARAFEAKGDLKQALAGYEEAAKLAPNNQKLMQKIEEVRQKLGQQ